MASGFSPKLPIRIDPQHGFSLTKTPREAVKQNFKNLILTSPGERIMIPEFGVGLRRYLFEPQSTVTFRDLRGRIQDQVSTYLPFIHIKQIRFFSGGVVETTTREEIFSLDEFNFNADQNENMLFVSISYNITTLNADEILDIQIKG